MVTKVKQELLAPYAIDEPWEGAPAPTPRTDMSRWATRKAIAGRDFGIATDGTDQADIINGLMQALGERGGGVLELPETGTGSIGFEDALDNKWPEVLVTGAGRGRQGQAGDGVGTRLKALSANGLLHRTPVDTGTPVTKFMMSGGGFEDLYVDGNNLCGIALHVTSRFGGRYRMCAGGGFQGTEMYLFDCLRGSGTEILGAADNQEFYADLIGNGYSTATDIVRFSGTPGVLDANTSVAREIWIRALTGTGTGVVFENADFLYVNLRHFSNSTGKPFDVHGQRALTVCGDNTLTWFTSNTAGRIEGTEGGGVTQAGQLMIYGADQGNSTPAPTLGTGVKYYRRVNTRGLEVGLHAYKLAVGSGIGGADAAHGAIGTDDSIYNWNTGGRHHVMRDSSGIWSHHTDTGSMKFVREAGSGTFDLPAIGQVRFNTLEVSVGANNSGGSGFRLLRVPNA